ncbi:FAD-dependent monooxygenase [Nocardiopsis sp. B62]|uniref:FAD-dependent monooxygenase n=1 Tax=Nocardiopsis sp. B62 TaxID=2824874 RepID=UPI001B36D7D0|nr:FAD-dependent monooxygenase [Nocardiopsis sp. B62]MBQ1080750.1 FAD-dependent monooxygenase [Nocardiopsis sp. B62]
MSEPRHHDRPRAVVVGGSLAGLTTALALALVGCRAQVLERSGPALRTGGALSAAFAELAPVIGDRHARTALGTANPRGRGRRAADPMPWTVLREGLRRAVEDEPLVSLHHSTRVTAINQNEHSAWADTDGGRTFAADLVVGADGHRSLVRRTLVPEHPDASYAGYALWIGQTEEASLRGVPRTAPGLFIEASGPHYLLGYPMPHEGGRTLGWAWYDATRNDLMRSTGSVAGRVVRHSLRASAILDPVYRELVLQARRHWPSPWAEAIIDSIDRREVTGVPIAEYVPRRLAAGRLAIVGNAAHVPTPMTGSGFAASLQDAAWLSRELAAADSATVPGALARYENTRLDGARDLVRSGQGFSRSFATQP